MTLHNQASAKHYDIIDHSCLEVTGQCGTTSEVKLSKLHKDGDRSFHFYDSKGDGERQHLKQTLKAELCREYMYKRTQSV